MVWYIEPEGTIWGLRPAYRGQWIYSMKYQTRIAIYFLSFTYGFACGLSLIMANSGLLKPSYGGGHYWKVTQSSQSSASGYIIFFAAAPDREAGRVWTSHPKICDFLIVWCISIKKWINPMSHARKTRATWRVNMETLAQVYLANWLYWWSVRKEQRVPHGVLVLIALWFDTFPQGNSCKSIPLASSYDSLLVIQFRVRRL